MAKKRFLTGCYLLVTAALIGTLTHLSYASVSLLSYTASPTQTNVGKTFTVTLSTRVDNGPKATGEVDGKIVYPTAKLKLVSAKAGTYPRLSVATASGSITLTSPKRAAGNGYSGSYTLVVATFSAKEIGSATVKSSGGSMVINGTSHTSNNVTEIIYDAACPAGQTGTPPNCTTPPPAPPPTPTPTPEPEPESDPIDTTDEFVDDTEDTTDDITADVVDETVDDFQVTEDITITLEKRKVSATTAILSFVSSTPLKEPKLFYGKTSDAGDGDIVPMIDGVNITASLAKLKPGVRYYFTLEATDNTGTLASYNGEVTTLGYPVKIITYVSESKGTNRQVMIDGKSYKTDKNGIVTLRTTEGSHSLVDTASEFKQSIKVAALTPDSNDSLKTQEFRFDIELPSTLSKIAAPLSFLGVFILLIGGGLFMFFRRRKRQQNLYTYDPGSGATNTGEASLPTMTESVQPVVSSFSSQTPGTPFISEAPPQPVSLAQLLQPHAPAEPSTEDAFDPFLHDSPFALHAPTAHDIPPASGNTAQPVDNAAPEAAAPSTEVSHNLPLDQPSDNYTEQAMPGEDLPTRTEEVPTPTTNIPGSTQQTAADDTVTVQINHQQN